MTSQPIGSRTKKKVLKMNQSTSRQRLTKFSKMSSKSSIEVASKLRVGKSLVSHDQKRPIE